jgi:hypothetical protein
MKYGMKYGKDARAEELEHLKLALATFALQLDVFEMRTHDVLLAVGKSGNHDPPADRARWPREKNGLGGQ